MKKVVLEFGFFSTELNDIEETLNRIKACPGVTGVLIVSSEGTPIRSTMDSKQTGQFASILCGLSVKARSLVRELDYSNDVTFLRIKSKQFEVLVCPEKDSILMVIQDHSVIESSKA